MAGEKHPWEGRFYLALDHISRDEEVEDLFRPLSRH
jgi:hypothetical protein